MKNVLTQIGRRIQYETAAHVAGPTLVQVDHARQKLKKALSKRSRGSRPFGPPLESTRKMKELMVSHYLAGRYADGAKPVAWITSGFPVEFLRPFGFHVVYPENHGALCGVQRKSVALAQSAEEWGLPRDTCGYARCDIGSTLTQSTPVGRLPKPDVLLACTNICQTVVYWFRTLSRILDVPLVIIDTPFQYGEAGEHAEAYVAEQLENLIAVCEQVSGRKMDPGDLTEAARLSKEGSELWGECLALAKHKPAPWTGFDAFMHIGPIVTLRGMPACNAYYRLLRDELSDRVSRGIGALRDEKHRLLWDNIPIWYELRSLSRLLAESGFAIVVTSYTNGWAETSHLFDPDDPIRSAAKVYTRIFLNRDLEYRQRLLRQLAQDYECDGAILHSNHSCKPYSMGQIDLAERLSREAGLRTMIVDADHVDSRVYAKEQVEGRLSAFMESFGS